MRTRALSTFIAATALAFSASAAPAGGLDGTVKLGGIYFDEEGDRSTVQETYNIHDGFSLSQILLDGAPSQRSYLKMDLRELNLDSRQGDLVYRIPGAFKLTAGYDQGRQVFDPDRAVTSDRKDLKLGLQATPSQWLGLSGYLNYLNRGGERLSFPAGTQSVLGTEYDNRLVTGQIAADVRKNKFGGGINFRMTDFGDELNSAADRTGSVVSARAYAPGILWEKLSHYLRGAYGVRKLSNGDLDYTLANFQYTGVIRPVEAFQLQYNFDANRIDNQSTRLKTDRFQNNVDATYYYQYGNITGGYGYEMNDDDRTLTSYDTWRAATTFNYRKVLHAKVDYADRTKKDQEELTLLKDIEASRFHAKVQVEPREGLVVGGDYAKREREFPDIGVTADGEMASGFGRYRQAGWGTLSVDYSYSKDSYVDLAAGFDTWSHIVTGRIEIERIRDLRLGFGATYMDIGEDLDIEKSMISMDASYRFLRNYRIEAKYNVYNYDDYILLDRYYTANVVWFDIAYDFHLE